MKTLKTPAVDLDRLKVAVGFVAHVCNGAASACKGITAPMRTANSAEHRLSALVTPNAQDISGLENGAWYLIAPYGSYPSPNGKYTQIFGREEADHVVRTWNSMPGLAARYFKNLVHGLGARSTSPVWDGHPESDKKRWPKENLLAETTDLRATDAGLEGCMTWNEKGLARRTRGPLYPSPLWWHFPPDAEAKVYPEMLESIGLVPTPNIAAVPAWTQNAALDPASAEVTTTNTEEDETMIPIAKKLGLPENASEADILAKIGELLSTSNSAAENLRTANATKDGLQADVDRLNRELATANGLVTTRGTEIGNLSTANSELTGIVTELAGGVVHGFELAGVTSGAERDNLIGKLTANATAVATVAELKGKKAVVPVRKIELGATKLDISTANARREVLDAEIAKRMKDNGGDRDKAFAACQTDPALKPLFDAMADPSKAAA